MKILLTFLVYILINTTTFAQMDITVGRRNLPYITWLYSADIRVIGYYIKYGEVGGKITNVYNCKYTNLIDLNILNPTFSIQKTNFIFVTAYDLNGNESGPSKTLYYKYINDKNMVRIKQLNTRNISFK